MAVGSDKWSAKRDNRGRDNRGRVSAPVGVKHLLPHGS